MSRLDLPAFLTVRHLAELLHVSKETIARRAREGTYPTVPGLRQHRFPRDQLWAVLTNQKSLDRNDD